eukprot:Gregarina_sp_Pseudo_9__1415@NODE_1947_length_1238_cov_8_259383_g1804_i0_p1_GENE_NODE_1947_length_1238_cov_8_259383_g1804_i0NODE_1947_length_1238_cov_8_259383_g1804_i0_p1_ORF_typecomplete_len399_score75_64WD40/PF00400_32/2_9e03WD40/PF00400_32/3e03WD40/PF00400_32/3_7WD40/PF00400_32/8_2e05WD40/PF00400_32/3_1e10WD40/PF00400_32/4_3e02WD40/PF00400_32/1_9e05ANAPC4_WD40/PF12894_7/3_1e02ANAPC4_WD40/PF12894_7/0_0007ANAPC4_WD40/PF12894_7/3e06ANAPC4_WD40/PF12894_7/0_028ANAPC4_WD40/PF12894_7/0_00027Ge1_WD40/
MPLKLAASSGAQACGGFWDLAWKDGTRIFTCGGLNIIEWLWDKSSEVQTVRQAAGRFPKVHTKSIRRMMIVEPSLLIAGGFDALISIYSLAEETETKEYAVVGKIEAHESEIKGVSAIAATTKSPLLIASCGRDKSVWLHGEYKEAPEAGADKPSPVKSEFYCASVLTEHSQDVKSVRFHPTRRLLMSTSYDKSTRIYSESDGDWKQVQAFEDHSDTVWDLAYSPDGKYFATCGADGHVYFYRSQQPKINATDLAAVPASSLMRAAIKVAAQPRGTETWRLDGFFAFHDQLLGQPIYTIDWCTQQSVSGPQTWDVLALGCGDNSIRILRRQRALTEVGDWELVASELEAHEGDVNCVRWSKPVTPPNAPLSLASCGEDGVLKIWHFE